jgi:hypothetical protein
MGVEPAGELAGEVEAGAGARTDVEMDEDRLVRHGGLRERLAWGRCSHAAPRGA